jgi:hypothetical protein
MCLRPKWIGHVLRRNCLLKHVIEGKIEGKGRRGRRCKELLHDFEENEKLRKLWIVGALDRAVWRTGFGSGCGPVIRQTAE